MCIIDYIYYVRYIPYYAKEKNTTVFKEHMKNRTLNSINNGIYLMIILNLEQSISKQDIKNVRTRQKDERKNI